MYKRRQANHETKIIKTLAITRQILLRIAGETKAFLDDERYKYGIFDPLSHWRSTWTSEDEHYYRKAQAKRALADLQKRKYIKESKQGNKIIYALTDKGKTAAFRDALRLARVNKAGRIVLISFDIPESQAAIRSRLRYLLKDLHFSMIHKSVWKSELDVASVIAKMVKELKAEKWVRVFDSLEVIHRV